MDLKNFKIFEIASSTRLIKHIGIFNNLTNNRCIMNGDDFGRLNKLIDLMNMVPEKIRYQKILMNDISMANSDEKMEKVMKNYGLKKYPIYTDYYKGVPKQSPLQYIESHYCPHQFNKKLCKCMENQDIFVMTHVMYYLTDEFLTKLINLRKPIAAVIHVFDPFDMEGSLVGPNERVECRWWREGKNIKFWVENDKTYTHPDIMQKLYFLNNINVDGVNIRVIRRQKYGNFHQIGIVIKKVVRQKVLFTKSFLESDMLDFYKRYKLIKTENFILSNTTDLATNLKGLKPGQVVATNLKVNGKDKDILIKMIGEEVAFGSWMDSRITLKDFIKNKFDSVSEAKELSTTLLGRYLNNYFIKNVKIACQLPLVEYNKLLAKILFTDANYDNYLVIVYNLLKTSMASISDPVVMLAILKSLITQSIKIEAGLLDLVDSKGNRIRADIQEQKKNIGKFSFRKLLSKKQEINLNELKKKDLEEYENIEDDNEKILQEQAKTKQIITDAQELIEQAPVEDEYEEKPTRVYTGLPQDMQNNFVRLNQTVANYEILFYHNFKHKLDLLDLERALYLGLQVYSGKIPNPFPNNKIPRKIDPKLISTVQSLSKKKVEEELSKWYTTKDTIAYDPELQDFYVTHYYQNEHEKDYLPSVVKYKGAYVSPLSNYLYLFEEDFKDVE